MATETVSLRRDGNDLAGVLFDAVAIITAARRQLSDVEDGIEGEALDATHCAGRALNVVNGPLATAAGTLMDCSIDAANQETAQRLAPLCRRAAA